MNDTLEFILLFSKDFILSHNLCLITDLGPTFYVLALLSPFSKGLGDDNMWYKNNL